MSKRVSIDTKWLIILLIIIILYLWIQIFPALEKENDGREFFSYASNPIQDADVYYVKQLSPGDQEYGLGIGENSSIFFYNTINNLLTDLISKQPNANIFFENVAVSAPIVIDNSLNHITNQQVSIKFLGNLRSTLHGGASYSDPSLSNTYAITFSGISINFDNFDFQAQTVAIKIENNTSLSIYKSNVISRPSYLNEFSSGTISNQGNLHIKSSTIKWEDGSTDLEPLPNGNSRPEVKGYAIYSFSNVYIDENLDSHEAESWIEGHGGIYMQNGGELFLYNGKIVCNNEASSEGYKTLLLVNSNANLFGGELTLSENSNVELPVVIKQSTLHINSNDVFIEKNIFLGASDTNLGSSIIFDEFIISVDPGGYDLKIVPTEETSGITFEEHEKILIQIINLDDDHVRFQGWGDGYENEITLDQALQMYSSGEIKPAVEIYSFMSYKYLSNTGEYLTRTEDVVRGASHSILSNTQDIYFDFLRFKCWTDLGSSNSYQPGETIDQVLRDYTFREVLYLPKLEIEASLLQNNGDNLTSFEGKITQPIEGLKINNIIDNPKFSYEIHWYYKSNLSEDYELIETFYSNSINIQTIENGWHKLEVFSNYSPFGIVDNELIYQSLNECEFYVNLELSNGSDSDNPNNPDPNIPTDPNDPDDSDNSSNNGKKTPNDDSSLEEKELEILKEKKKLLTFSISTISLSVLIIVFIFFRKKITKVVLKMIIKR